MKRKKSDNIRYYLHRKVGSEGLDLDAKRRTIYLPQSSGLFVSDSLKRLMGEFNYVVQITIL